MSPSDHFSPTLSWVLWIALVLGPIVNLFGALLRRARNARLARSARRSMEQGVTEQLGEACVVAGTVAYAAGESVAARVEIDQDGSEQDGSGGWSHRWKEVSRRILVAPFYLVRADGARVRVEPTRLAQLVDDLDGKILVRRDRRIVSAELTPGETVWVVGSFATGIDPENNTHYRGGPGRVLGAPKAGPMLLSSKPLDERYAARARVHARFAVVHLAFALLCAWLAWPFLDRALGATTTGVVTEVTEVLDDEKDRVGWDVRFSASGRADENRLSAPVPVGESVPVRAGKRSVQIGERATLAYGVLWLIVGAGLLAFVYRFWAKDSLPWYRSRVDATGSGRLDDVDEKAQIAARVAANEAEAAKSPEALRAAAAERRAERKRKNVEAKERARKERASRER